MFFYFRNFLILYSLTQTIPTFAESQTRTLYYAAELGDSARVHHLLATGVPIDDPDNKGRTALIYAASRGHLGIVKLLLQKGANIHVEGQYNLNPLHAAIRRHHTDIVKVLLEAGADIHLSDLNGTKPLALAVMLGHIDIVHLLLERGANPNTRAEKGIFVLQWAQNNGHTAIVEALLKYGADPKVIAPPPSKWSSLPTTDTLAIRTALEKGVEPALALRLAVELEDTTLVRQLITNDAVDINATTEGKVTPLMIAVGKCNEHLVQILINAGADLFALDERNFSVLAYTTYIRDQQKRFKMQRYLHQVINRRYIQH